jgi:hypothetical protein
MIHQHTCYSAECDTPGCEPWEDGTPHFDTAEKALAEVVSDYEWTLTDGVLRCPDCTNTYRCEQEGHQWRHWGGDPTLRLAQEGCDRCGHTRLVGTQAHA